MIKEIRYSRRGQLVAVAVAVADSPHSYTGAIGAVLDVAHTPFASSPDGTTEPAGHAGSERPQDHLYMRVTYIGKPFLTDGVSHQYLYLSPTRDRKIAAEHRDNFRRQVRSAAGWDEYRQGNNLPKNPDTTQWLDAADALGVDTVPFESESAPSSPSAPSAGGIASAVGLLAQQITELAQQAQQAPAIDESDIVRLIKKHTETRITVEVRDRHETRSIEGSVHAAMPEILKWLSVRQHVYLVGPAGSGKTTIAEQAAKALDLPLYTHGAVLMKYEVTGHSDAQGEYHASGLREAYENGGIVLFDEMDASAPEAIVAINAALANGRYGFPDKQIKRHDDFVCIAAANTSGRGATRQYVGRNPLDGASLDRFVQIQIEYDLTVERAMAQIAYATWGGADKDVAGRWTDEVQAFRAKCAKHDVDAIISPRATEQGARGLAAGIDIAAIREQALYKGLTADQRAQMGV
jgi:MoxR-like ATPase